MNIEDLKKTKLVGILGFGQEGQAIADYLTGYGIKVKIYDGRELNKWKTQNLAKLEHLKLSVYSGFDFIEKALDEAFVLFRSPGIKLSDEHHQISDKKNILITSQAQWFFEHCGAKIIGVTGTKGKGTTSSLIYQILKNAKIFNGAVFLTGNIGKIQPLEFLDDLEANDLVVYELSSFQLQDLNKSPNIGVCLMVTSDHLDYHQDLIEYHQAKSSIAKFQNQSDYIISNIDYPASKAIGEQGDGQKWFISKKTIPSQGAQIIEDEEQIIIFSKKSTETISTKDSLLRGKHNLENIAAASLVAKILNVSIEDIQKEVDSFTGLQHRLQFVSEKNGVKYYNDSISTIPGTTIAAIKSFPINPIVLIIGGAEKNLDYQELVNQITTTNNIKHIICMGPVGKKIKDLLTESNYPENKISGSFDNFDIVVNSAKSLAVDGDVVLMSPGASSFDMFSNYEERGNEFVKLVNR